MGTGTRSRRTTTHPHAQLEVEGGHAGPGGSGAKHAHKAPGRRKAGAPQRRQLTEKQAERERKRAIERRHLQVRLASIAAGVIAVLALWAGISGSQLFEIKKVEVVGATQIPYEDVVSLAAIEDGETLLRIDGGALVGRLKTSPWVEDARVSRRIPSTLRITIDERVPVAVVDTGMTFWFVDGEYRVLSESIPSSATVLPVIRDIPGFTAEPGTISDSDVLRNAVQVLGGISSELRATVRTVAAPSVHETTLLTSSGVEVMIGEATRLAEKSALVADIIAEGGGAVVFVDVRSVERPISRGLGD